DPYLAYSGNPTEEDSAYYCFAPPIVEAANRYLTEHGQPAAARDISGATQTMLMNCLCAGYPVVMWATLGFREPCQGNLKWTLTDNTLYTAYNNLHCFVLKGYDGENFSVADPLFGDLTVDYATLMQQYMAVGSHAAVLELHRAEAPWADSRRLV
ncbi:MAG: C39 family peptidase, partial [Ruthenibacterium sp.]